MSIKAGHIIDQKILQANHNVIRGAELEIADGLYLAPLDDEEFSKSMIYFNHSCEPNCGVGGNILSIAMRDIKAGEELTQDYVMYFCGPNYSMTCNCQSKNCRHTITGNDWQIPELQEKYKGYFSWYIEQKINQLIP